jgi:hypothetical protein
MKWLNCYIPAGPERAGLNGLTFAIGKKPDKFLLAVRIRSVEAKQTVP